MEQTEGFRGEGGGGMVMGIKEDTGCYTQTMNQGTLHQKLMMYCMVTNTT